MRGALRAAPLLRSLFIASRAPFLLAEFYVTLMNYIGLATLVSARPGAAHRRRGPDVVRPAGLRRHRRLHHRGADHGVRRFAVAFACSQALILVAAVSLFLGVITLRLSGHYLPISTIAWGIAIYFLFGNLEMLGKYTGLAGHPGHLAWVCQD